MNVPTEGTFPDGRLIESSPIAFTEEEITAWEEGTPEIRALLQRVEIRTITYMSDGLRVRGILAAPKEGKGFPCLIYNRGGNRDFGAITKKRAALFIARVASWGYVVVGSQYRGNMGGEGQEEFGGADVNDVLNLIPLLERLPNSDASRIGMYGRSRGGMMTYLALARTKRIAAGIVDAGEADLLFGAKRRPEMADGVFAELIPDYYKESEAQLEARSAICWPEKLCKETPILLLHGTADWRVSPLQAMRMAIALYEANHPFRFVLFEGGDHGLSEHREEVFGLIKQWLNHYVRDRLDWPSLEPHGP